LFSFILFELLQVHNEHFYDQGKWFQTYESQSYQNMSDQLAPALMEIQID